MFSYNPAQRPVVQSWISLTTGYPKIQSKLPNSLLINFDIIIISSEILPGPVGVFVLKSLK
jgi:hypothetical protein